MQRTLGRGRGRVDTQSDVRGFVEISVLDDGVGIAARQSGDEAIYWKAMARERQYVLDALAERGSIKPKTQDTKTRGDVGYGFTHINSSLQRLGAWASLRTGRLLVTCDAAPRGTAAFVMQARTHPYVPGTALEVIVPVRWAFDREGAGKNMPRVKAR